MNRAVDYDFQDDDDLRYVHFKSPFNRPSLIVRRPPLRLRYAVLLHAPACWFVRTCAEVNFELFSNFDGLLHAVWVSVCRKNMGKRILRLVRRSSVDYLQQWCTT